jgi:HAT1-interacting factor 1
MYRLSLTLRPCSLVFFLNFLAMAENTQSIPASAIQDKRVQLDDLIARAAAKDATKDHNSASELYSQATELQAELNGELSLENADLLYAYGKSLFNVAVSKSDVLGTKVADPQPQNAPSSNATSTGPRSTSGDPVKDTISNAVAKNARSRQEESTPSEIAPSKPFFQFTGDENFVDSDSDDDEDGEPDGEEEEEDDFANAFEVLDLARILYVKKLDVAEESNTAKGKSTELPADVRHIKERLADTYDLQAEISLEAERFSDAVTDLRTSLDLRNSLFPFEDPSVAECHFKLSLALEFASVSQSGDTDDEKGKTVDETLRREAATQMERAIESCKVRMAQEENKLKANKGMDEDKVTAAKRKIANVQEIVADMEQRVSLSSPET